MVPAKDHHLQYMLAECQKVFRPEPLYQSWYLLAHEWRRLKPRALEGELLISRIGSCGHQPAMAMVFRMEVTN